MIWLTMPSLPPTSVHDEICANILLAKPPLLRFIETPTSHESAASVLHPYSLVRVSWRGAHLEHDVHERRRLGNLPVDASSGRIWRHAAEVDDEVAHAPEEVVLVHVPLRAATARYIWVCVCVSTKGSGGVLYAAWTTECGTYDCHPSEVSVGEECGRLPGVAYDLRVVVRAAEVNVNRLVFYTEHMGWYVHDWFGHSVRSGALLAISLTKRIHAGPGTDPRGKYTTAGVVVSESHCPPPQRLPVDIAVLRWLLVT